MRNDRLVALHSQKDTLTPFRVPALSRFRVCIRLLTLTLAALCLSSCAPHMYDQPNLRPFKQQLPPMPEGTTPRKGRAITLVEQQAKSAKNPIAVTPETTDNGRIYYGYYCLMCHGKRGDGNGPVGESYDPKPTDLRSPATARMTDGQLYRAMLTGTGHEPVMIGTVHPDQRWPLVAYVRTLTPSR